MRLRNGWPCSFVKIFSFVITAKSCIAEISRVVMWTAYSCFIRLYLIRFSKKIGKPELVAFCHQHNFIYWSFQQRSANLIYSSSSCGAYTKPGCMQIECVNFLTLDNSEAWIQFILGSIFLLLSLLHCGHKSFWFPSLTVWLMSARWCCKLLEKKSHVRMCNNKLAFCAS